MKFQRGAKFHKSCAHWKSDRIYNARIGELSKKVCMLKPDIGKMVDGRIHEFEGNRNWFSELCFCILTANYTAEGGIRIQNAVPDFSKLSREEIERSLRSLGHRFPRARSGYIDLARKHKDSLKMLPSMRDSMERRKWLVKNVKGLGYKESSHFLRNVGFFDVAIIDRHILSILEQYRFIEKPRSLSRKTYLEIEDILRQVAMKSGTTLAELDLYLWYMKTGKILK